MSVIPDDFIRQAAIWLASQQRESHEELWIVPHHIRLSYYFDRAYWNLKQASGKITDETMIEMGVPCGRDKNGSVGVATVNISPDKVLGYLPGDWHPSFIWPPDVAFKYLERCALSSSRDQAPS